MPGEGRRRSLNEGSSSRSVRSQTNETGRAARPHAAGGGAVKGGKVTGRESRRSSAPARAEAPEPGPSAESQLRHYRGLFEFAPQAFVVTDVGGRIEEANGEAARLLNLPRAFLRGRSILIHVPLDERPAFREAIKQRIDVDRPLQWASLIRPRSKPPIDVAISIVSIFDDEWRVIGASWILQDISQNKEAEAELKRARDDLELRVRERTADLELSNRQKDQLVEDLQRANEAKDEFLGLLSHELRTSMTVIYGGVKAVQRMSHRIEDEEVGSLLENVDVETEVLYRMIEDLLNLARLELGESVTTEPVMLQHVLQRFARSFTHTRRNRLLVLEVPDDLEPVEAEPTYLEQILRNLVNNAEKYSPEHEQIEVRVANDAGGEVVISVLDRGPGIPEEETEAVFERFYRSSRTPRNVRGMGMGLTVCKRLVEAQRGRIWLRPREKGGLEASFTLPMARDGEVESA